MKLTKTCLFLASMTALLIGSASSAFANDDEDLPINAHIKTSCIITTLGVTFPDYDPLAATALNSTGGSVSIACTKGANTPISLGLGIRSNRTMSDGTNTLQYALFQNEPRTINWGTGLESLSPGAAPNKNPRPFTVYGQIPAGQDKPTGDYSDTVLATVNF